MAMFTTEAYLQQPAAELIDALQLYSISLQVWGGGVVTHLPARKTETRDTMVIFLN